MRKRLEYLGYRETARTTRMHLGRPARLRQDHVFGAFNLYWG